MQARQGSWLCKGKGKERRERERERAFMCACVCFCIAVCGCANVACGSNTYLLRERLKLRLIVFARDRRRICDDKTAGGSVGSGAGNKRSQVIMRVVPFACKQPNKQGGPIRQGSSDADSSLGTRTDLLSRGRC